MTTPEKKAMRIATATLKSARLTAKASKARLRALKSEVKIQKQHHKWARKQVRVAKEALAQWQATAEAALAAPPAPEAEAEPPAHAASEKPERKKKGSKRKERALALERITLVPVAPQPTAAAGRSDVSPKELPSTGPQESPAARGEAAPPSGTETAH